jgi:hypothetical protein
MARRGHRKPATTARSNPAPDAVPRWPPTARATRELTRSTSTPLAAQRGRVTAASVPQRAVPYEIPTDIDGSGTYVRST